MIEAPVILVGHKKTALLIEADTYDEIVAILDALGIDVDDCDTGQIAPWNGDDIRELH